MNKCEQAGFEHAWEDVTPQEVYLTNPPQFPPKTEKCKNCGLTRRYVTVQREIKEWKYSEV
jgi:hypothetical protein